MKKSRFAKCETAFLMGVMGGAMWASPPTGVCGGVGAGLPGPRDGKPIPYGFYSRWVRGVGMGVLDRPCAFGNTSFAH